MFTASLRQHSLVKTFRTLALLLVTLTACTRHTELPVPAKLKQGASFLHFDYERSTELLIIKADPSTGDHWTARLQRPDTQHMNWKVSLGGDHAPIQDQVADSALIMHLLDTLRTLHPLEIQIAGPPESLGLAPPRFALQWNTEGDEQKKFDLQIGAPTKAPGSAYASIPQQAPFIATGAALQMLELLNDAAALRLKQWTGLSTDEIDEIELKQKGKPIFYAQREGADWTNRQHKPLRGDITAWLEKLTHGRVLAFVDDPKAALATANQVRKRPLREAILTDRKGQATRLLIGRTDAAHAPLFGLSSARPEGVFELYPAALSSLDPPR